MLDSLIEDNPYQSCLHRRFQRPDEALGLEAWDVGLQEEVRQTVYLEPERASKNTPAGNAWFAPPKKSCFKPVTSLPINVVFRILICGAAWTTDKKARREEMLNNIPGLQGR